MRTKISSKRSIHVLLVDDEQDFTFTLSKRLFRRGMSVTTAADGTEAFGMIESDTPDVVVLDIDMPGLDGLQTLRAIRKSFHGVEVILLTGGGSLSEELEAFQVGAFDFLRKPTDANQLTCRINAAVRGKLGKNHICERSDATRMESRGSLS